MRIKISSASDVIGTIEFNRDSNSFLFNYDENFDGFPFGEINSDIDRKFESNTMFPFFEFEDCGSRQKIAEKHDLKNPDSNDAQWFILNLFAEKKQSLRGMRFEVIQ